MPPSSAGRAAALEALAALKSSVPGVKLKKNEGRGGDEGEDFIVDVRLPVTSSSLPAAAEAYDVPAAWLLASVSCGGGNTALMSISVSSFECEGLSQKILDRATAGLRAAAGEE